MMHLKEVNTALDHKITGGSEFMWHCFPEARYLDYETEYAHASVIFNTKTQEVYAAEVNDKPDKLPAYRWLNPSYIDAFKAECLEKNIDYKKAWDNKNWTDLEVSDDWLDKAKAIMNGETFDKRITVPLDLPDNELFQLMKLAHERDVTLNKMVEIVLQEVIDKHNMSTEIDW